MPLVLLIVFLAASALAVSSAEAVGQTRRGRAEKREKQEREEAEEREKIAAREGQEAKRQREERQRELERLALPAAFLARLETLRARYRAGLAPLEAALERALSRAKRLTNLAVSVRDALPARSGAVWAAVTALLVGAIWLVCFSVEVTIDQRSFAGLGYPPTMALLLAVIASLVFSAIGLVLSDLVGLTRLFPFTQRLRRFTRCVVILDVLAIAAFCLYMLPPIVQYRSAPLSAQVETLAQNQRVIEQGSRTDPRLPDVEHKLAAAREKLSTAHYADQRLGIGAAVLEGLTSWGAIWLAMLAANAGLLAGTAQAKRRAAASQLQVTQQERNFQAELAALAEEVGISPEQLRQMLADDESTPASDPADGASEESGADEPEEPDDDEPLAEPDASDDDQRPPGDWADF